MEETTKGIRLIPEPLVESLKRGTNYFLGIGINAYQNYSHLNNAVKDIRDVADALLQDYYFEQKNISFLLEEEATHENIIEELNELPGKLKADDRILIYYSGHGKMEGELGYWVPFDAKREKKASLINNSEVQAIIRTIKARHVLLISDSCFSGSLLSRDASRLAGGAFIDFEKNSSRFVFSSGKGEVSDGQIGTNSPFAAAILKDLKTNEEAINIVLLADNVTKRVRFNYAQRAECAPMYQSGHDGGQFVFFKRQTEKDRWLAAVNQNTEAGYLKYLDEYPNGQFVREAELNMHDIADEKAWETAARYDAAFSYRNYLQKFPNGKHSVEARANIDEILEKENKIERERLSKIEAERIEASRLAKLEADKIERERLAKIEADRIEAARLAKLEADKIERERLAKIEADIEAARLAKLQADRVERERLEKIEAARLAKLEADKTERERLQKIETGRVLQENFAEFNKTQPVDEILETSPIPAKKYNIAAIGGGVIVIGAISIWFFTKSPASTPTNPVTPIETLPSQNTLSNTTKDNSQTPNVSAQTNSEPVKPKTEPTKQVEVTKKSVSGTKPKPKPTASDDDNTPTETYSAPATYDNTVQQRQEAQLQQQHQDAVKKVKSYLSLASALIDSDDKTMVISNLNKALNVSDLPSAIISNIKTAKAFMESNDYKLAKNAIEKAKNNL